MTLHLRQTPIVCLALLIFVFPGSMSIANGDLVFLNSGFEDAGATAADSAHWIEDGLPFTASRRDTSVARTGAASHHLGGIVEAGAGDGSIHQDTLAVGLPSLLPGDKIVAEFWAIASLDLGASATYQLDIVNSAGSIVVSSGQQTITDTQSTWELFSTRAQPLQVPAFGSGSDSAYGAQLSINGIHNGSFTSVSYDLFIDDVSLISTVPEPGATWLAATALFGLLVRRRRFDARR